MLTLGLGLGLPYGAMGSGFDPAALAYDIWDAERADTLTLAGSAVTEWRSVKNGYVATQAVGSARPVYGASSFNGRPGLTFDGLDDELTMIGVGALPVGNTPCEIWVAVDQTALAADTAVRVALAYGGTAATRRATARIVTTGVNRARVDGGDGSNTIVKPNASVDYSGRHVARSTFSGTEINVEVDGVSTAAQAVAPLATISDRLRIGAASAAAPNNFHQGVINFVAVTPLLSTDQAAQMLAYLKARGGIA